MTKPFNTYRVTVDLNRDGTGAVSPSIEDISDYVVNFQFKYGMSQPNQEVAEPSFGTIILDNSGKDFLPERVDGVINISNYDFTTWSGGNPSSWTVTGESGSNPEISQVGRSSAHGGSGTGACNIYSTASVVSVGQNACVVGQTYRVRFKVTKATSGAIVVKNNTTVLFGPIRKAGEYEFFFNATHANIKIESVRYTCDITIDDFEIRKFNKYAMLESGMVCRITFGAGSGSLQYVGKIAEPITYAVDPRSGQISGQMVTLRLTDPIDDLQRADYTPKLETNIDTWTAIKHVFDDVPVHWTSSNRNAILDAQGYCELDAGNRVFTPISWGGDLGKTTHEFLGDVADRGQGVSAYGYIKDIAEAECGGRFYWHPPAEAFYLQNRHHDLLNTTTAYTLTDAHITKLNYTYGKSRINRATMSYTLKEVGAPASVVWTMTAMPFEMKNGTSKTVTVRYKDPDNEKARVGARDHIIPTPHIDYVANEQEDASGADVSEYISVSAEFKAASTKITYDNHSGHDLWLQSAQLRATPIKDIPETFEYQDADTIGSKMGPREFPIEVRFLSSRTLAEDYCRWMVTKFKNTTPTFEGISFYANESATTLSAAEGVQIGSKIQINETYTQHSALYITVGIEHSFDMGSGVHLTTLVLKPDGRERICILNQTGRDELDSVYVGF